MAAQDLFETYFKKADLDRDGKISGAEAVSFFQGSNLPKQVLAQIWGYADQSRSGFLGRTEFFNFLKLVTVAQSKRDLTPDIVKAALYGPAASKIPAPQINVSATVSDRSNPVPVSSSASNIASISHATSQNLGFPGQGSQQSQLIRAPVSYLPGAASPMPQRIPEMSSQSLGTSMETTFRAISGTFGQSQSGAASQGMTMGTFGQSQAAAVSQFMPTGAFGQSQAAAIPQVMPSSAFGQSQAAAIPQAMPTGAFGQSQAAAIPQGMPTGAFGQSQAATIPQVIPTGAFGQSQAAASPQVMPTGAFGKSQAAAGPQLMATGAFGQSQAGGMPQVMPSATFGQSQAGRFPQVMPTGTFGQSQAGGISQGITSGTYGAISQVVPVGETARSSVGTFVQSQAGVHPQVISGQLGRSQPVHNSIALSGFSNTNSNTLNYGSNADAGSGFISSMQSQSVSLGLPSSTTADAKVNSSTFSGSDVFSAITSSKNEPAGQRLSIANTISQLPSSQIASSTQAPLRSTSLDSLQNAFATQSFGNQPSRSQSLPDLASQNTSTNLPASPMARVPTKTMDLSDSNQVTWPKMKPSDIQKYTKVFIEVDTDRDGRITGEQARNLFLSWRLPREVLKQVWDLSDQDSDSMLSLKEFCFALYLMERFREGRPLPTSLPSNIMYDETLLSMTGQSTAHGNAWNPTAGHGQQTTTIPIPSGGGLRPPIPAARSLIQDTRTLNQANSGIDVPVLNKLEARDRNSAMPATEDLVSDNKGTDIDKRVMDSKEKIEYYRTKMQELVLYKSRCDNKLNEITERALSDKREAEILGKKYEEKYKQVAEAASKLTIEEATFRDIQTRKMELNQAIKNVEQGGSADGLLQVRADRIHSDLDELMKALSERSKKHGIDVKSSSVIELPIGWQPGVPEGAATWDEEWDKFEDEGFSMDVSGPSKGPSPSHTNGSVKTKDLANDVDHSEDESSRSPQGSPQGSPPFKDPAAESHSFDDAAWLHVEADDEVDSVWGFSAGADKEPYDKQSEVFESDDYDLRHVRMASPTETAFPNKSVFFEDSVPATPASRFGTSPRYSEAGDQYDAFSGFDSFGVPDGKKNASFDSPSSTKDHTYSFDDADPFGSSGPFRVLPEK